MSAPAVTAATAANPWPIAQRVMDKMNEDFVCVNDIILRAKASRVNEQTLPRLVKESGAGRVYRFLEHSRVVSEKQDLFEGAKHQIAKHLFNKSLNAVNDTEELARSEAIATVMEEHGLGTCEVVAAAARKRLFHAGVKDVCEVVLYDPRRGTDDYFAHMFVVFGNGNVVPTVKRIASKLPEGGMSLSDFFAALKTGYVFDRYVKALCPLATYQNCAEFNDYLKAFGLTQVGPINTGIAPASTMEPYIQKVRAIIRLGEALLPTVCAMAETNQSKRTVAMAKGIEKEAFCDQLNVLVPGVTQPWKKNKGTYFFEGSKEQTSAAAADLKAHGITAVVKKVQGKEDDYVLQTTPTWEQLQKAMAAKETGAFFATLSSAWPQQANSAIRGYITG